MSTIADLTKHARELMHKAIESTKREFSTIRSNKASPSLLDLVRVEAYGNAMALNQVAMVAAPEPRLITVQPFDKSLTQAIEKAIREADLGLNPAVDGQLIRLPFPPLTEQRRKELVKVVHHKTEESRVAVRNVRRHAHEELRKLEKDGLTSQDDLKRHEDELQRMTDRHIATLDAEGKKKEAELLEL